MSKRSTKTSQRVSDSFRKNDTTLCSPPKLTFYSLDFQGNALVLLRTLTVLFLACFLLLCNALEAFHPVESFAVLQCGAVVLEPAYNVSASKTCLHLQLTVLLRRWPLGPAKRLSRQATKIYVEFKNYKQK